MVTLIELHCQLYVVGILIKCTELDYTVSVKMQCMYMAVNIAFTQKNRILDDLKIINLTFMSVKGTFKYSLINIIRSSCKSRRLQV